MNQSVLDKLNELFSISNIIEYRKGEIITFANQDPEGISLLLDGVVEQYDITPEGNTITVNIFKPPAFFPMSWAINKTTNTYFFAAVTDVKVKRLDSDKVVLFLKNNPDVTFDLLSRVYRGTDALLKRLVLAASGIASSRLIFELLIEAYRFGIDQDGNKTLIKVRQSNLAARSGLARETVSREIHKLKANGTVIITKEGIVLDKVELEKKLEFNI
jgi:CRP-like cAMP-binding protein